MIVGSYTCKWCGVMRSTAEGSKEPLLAPYAKPHVCDPKRVAEKRRWIVRP